MSYPGDVFREINNRLTQLENNYSTVRMNALEEAIQLIDRHAKSDHDTWLCRRLRDMQGVREARAAIEGEERAANFSEWWAKFNRTPTDSDAMNLSIYILSNPIEARREAAEAAWKAAWQVAYEVSKAEPIK